MTTRTNMTREEYVKSCLDTEENFERFNPHNGISEEEILKKRPERIARFNKEYDPVEEKNHKKNIEYQNSHPYPTRNIHYWYWVLIALGILAFIWRIS